MAEFGPFADNYPTAVGNFETLARQTLDLWLQCRRSAWNQPLASELCMPELDLAPNRFYQAGDRSRWMSGQAVGTTLRPSRYSGVLSSTK